MMHGKREALISPLPWHVDPSSYGQILDDNDVVVCHGLTHDEAELIVRCVNSHDALLSALKGLFEDGAIEQAIVEPGRVSIARAAIALAEGTSHV